MKISLKWLNDYISIPEFLEKPQELATLLTAAGLEVESIENLAQRFANVVVGCILKKDPHPGADRLTVCQVAAGDGVVHQIVCGAKNHNEGDLVVVALPGAVLPGNFAIKHSKIRGIDSGGMLCSEKELGLKAESASEGILLLPKDAQVGQPFAKYMGLDDVLLELKVTPNRADCLSHFGLAREISCLVDRPVQFPIESLIEDGGSTRELIKVNLRTDDLCPRFTGRGVRNVKVGPSPQWLKTRLESVGMNSINNIVDITNFVMLELGQPLHAYDVRDIQGRAIHVDRARAGEVFTTLDGTDLKLDGGELTIRDQERVLGLAGIIGGKNSGIKDDTTEVFIEAAYFIPSAVRRTARKFGINTDSAYRFARGTNPEAVPLALNRAAQLMQSVAGGHVMGDAVDLYPHPIQREPIEISQETLSGRLGYEVSALEFVMWMKRLGCEASEISNTVKPSWKVVPPLFRWDLNVDMDLVEEFGRLHGYQHIPETLPALHTAPALHDSTFTAELKIRHALQGQGAQQAVNYAFISRQFQEHILGQTESDIEKLNSLGLRAALSPVALMNPLNEDINVMRTALAPGLIKNAVYNSRQSNSFGRLFELGFGHFATQGDGEDREFLQEWRLAFAYWGDAKSLWAKAARSPVVFSLKGAVENLLNEMQITRWKWVTLKLGNVPGFIHPSQAAALQVEGKLVGYIGTLHPTLTEELKIREPLAVGEFNLEKILHARAKNLSYKPVSKMPAVDRDIAFAMPRALAVQDIEVEIKKLSGDLLKEVTVFDVFEGGSVEAGQKSVAFRLLFQAQDTTLEDAVINELRDRVVKAVEAKFGIVQRL